MDHSNEKYTSYKFRLKCATLSVALSKNYFEGQKNDVMLDH